MKQKCNDQEFCEIVKSTTSMAQLLQKLDMVCSGTNYKSIYKRIQSLDLSIEHWSGQTIIGDDGNIHRFLSRPYEDVFIENSTYNPSSLSKMIRKRNLMEYKCNKCGIKDWQGEELRLQLDHINGIRNDHRFENLRWLCPNCHSQTETWGCKSRKNCCVDCGKPLSGGKEKYNRCLSCASSVRQQYKINWPTLKELIEMVNNSSLVEVGERLGVTDNAVKKHIKVLLKREERVNKYIGE